MKRLPIIPAGTAVAVVLLGFASLGSSRPGVAATPPPPPPNPNASAAPVATAAATATPIPLFDNGTPAPASSATPAAPKDNRVGYDGVWEVQIQRADNTTYTHFSLKQTANALTGVYLDQDNKKYPVAGSIDGSQIRLVVSMPDGSTRLFEGKAEGTTDMLGMMTDSKEHVPFTAEYRPKENWLENINAAPGGLGNGGVPSSQNPH